MMGRHRESDVWEFFIPIPGDRAKCKLCLKEYAKGGGSTSGLLAHLKKQHEKQFCKKKEKTDSQSIPARPEKRKAVEVIDIDSVNLAPAKRHCARQATLSEAFENAAKYDINSSEAKTIHQLIGEFIITEYQPYRIVESDGFKRLVQQLHPRYSVPSRTFFSSNVVPAIVCRMKKIVQDELKNADSLSFTTDTWSHNSAGVSLISLTCHWVDDQFNRHNSVLAGAPFNERHTGENIAEKLKTVLSEFGIAMDKIHLFVRDGGQNVICGLNESHLNINSVHCLSHKFQLVLSDAIFEQKSVRDVLRKCRNVATHFNHSVTAQEILKDIQEKNSLPVHALLQDCEIRWNSTFDMLVRLQEQKKAIRLYKFERDLESFPSFSESEWELIDKVIKILAPIASKTKLLSFDNACVSVYIPMVKSLIAAISSQLSAAQGVKGTIRSMLESIERRFADMDKDKNLLIAAFLDPRFKDISKILPPDAWDKAVEMVREECRKIEHTSMSQSVGDSDNTEVSSPCNSATDDFWESMQADNAPESISNNSKSGVEFELTQYRRAVRPSIESSPYDWWKLYHKDYPLLSVVARRFLSAPPTSVPSERLFSSAGLIYNNQKRNRLLKEKASQFLFAKANLKRINYLY